MSWLFKSRHICLLASAATALLIIYFLISPTRLDYPTTFSPITYNKTGIPQFKFNPATKAYESNGKPIIWQYWHTEKMSLYVRLFTEALHCRNPEFDIIVAHESNAYKILPDLEVPEEIFKFLHPAHQSDVFRLAVLLKYGGVYTDIDVYPVDKIYPLYSLLSQYDLVIADSGKYNLAQAGMGPTRAQVSLFKVWHENQMQALLDYFPDESSYKNMSFSLPWMSILYHVEDGIKKEVDENRTKILRYSGKNTTNQLIEKDLAHYSHMPWHEMSPRFLPLNWTPFLFAWGQALRELYSDVTGISELMPKEVTIFSAFIGCALFDCQKEYSQLKMNGIKGTPTGHLDVLEVLRALDHVNRSVCDTIRKGPQEFPLFELEKYILR